MAAVKVVYLKLQKALYGTIKAARLFFDNLSSTLSDMGFTPNPYDICVTNKIINDTQCTITWHVDDLKISHKDPTVVSNIIKEIEKVYGEMTVC